MAWLWKWGDVDEHTLTEMLQWISVYKILSLAHGQITLKPHLNLLCHLIPPSSYSSSAQTQFFGHNTILAIF